MEVILIIKKLMANYKDLTTPQVSLETGNYDLNIDDDIQFHSQNSTRLGIKIFDDKVVIPAGLWELGLTFLHCGEPM